MPAQTVQKLDFREKLIQSGKKENTDALLKRLKVGSGFEEREAEGEAKESWRRDTVQDAVLDSRGY
jgi:hypothetical protein